MLFLRSVNELCQVEHIVSLTVAVPDPWRAIAATALEEEGLTCPCYFAPAGATRSGSTFNAVEVLAAEVGPAPDDLVAVHDAARPFATRHLLNRLCVAAAVTGAAVPGVPATDTIVRLEEGESEYDAVAYLERARLKAVQTPQVFRWEPFLEAHRWCHEEKRSFTDDGGLLAVRGLQPAVVMGEQENWKVTAEGDMARAEVWLRQTDGISSRE